MAATSPRVWAVGEGPVYQRFRERASNLPRVSCIDSIEALDVAEGEGALLSLRHGWSDAIERQQQRAARRRKLAYFHTRTDGSLGIVGPWLPPVGTGCVVCAETRRRMAIGAPTESRAPLSLARQAWSVQPWTDLVAAMVAQLVGDYINGSDAVPVTRAYVLDGARLSGRWHRFSPVGSCPECGAMPDDAPTLAAIGGESQPVATPGEYRVANASLSAERLRDELCDWRFGVIPRVYRAKGAPLAVSIAELGLSKSASPTAGYGRAPTVEASAFVAMLEALERHAGELPNGKRTVVRGSYCDLSADAIDPSTLGTHDPQYANHHAFRLSRYSPAAPMSWVWAYSLVQQRPVLVPEQIAYYRLRITDRQRRSEYCFYESSNGCALGSSIEEAALHGLFEVIERDAFLLAWYGRLSAPEILLDQVTDPVARLLVDRMSGAGYDAHLFNITSDVGVPAVWSLAVSRDPDRPRSFSAAAAHIDPRRAVLGALLEVAVNVVFKKEPDAARRAALHDMLATPEKIMTLEDHVDLYTLPEAFERLRFLLKPDRACLQLDEAFPDLGRRWQSNDVAAALRRIVDHLATLGLDAVVVDVTSVEQRPFGLRTAKVIVPGALPMTFGHVYHRTIGLPRLDAVLQSREAIVPHPFP